MAMTKVQMKQSNEQKLYGVLLAPDTIRFERLLPGSVELVWEYLTDAKKRGEWFAGGPMDLRVGGRCGSSLRIRS